MGGGGGGGQGGLERRIVVFLGGDVNAMLGVGGCGYGGCEPRLEGIVQCTKRGGDGGSGWWGGQGGCECNVGGRG